MPVPFRKSLETALDRILFSRSVNGSLTATPECSGVHSLRLGRLGSEVPAGRYGPVAASKFLCFPQNQPERAFGISMIGDGGASTRSTPASQDRGPGSHSGSRPTACSTERG